MSDKDLLLVLAALLAVVQFLYRYWDKKDNKQILGAIGDGITSFEPHVDRTKRTFGIVKELKAMHGVRDEDGRPLIYMPKEIIETQRALVELTHTVASTQEKMVALLAKMDEKIDEHKFECKAQFVKLDAKE